MQTDALIAPVAQSVSHPDPTVQAMNIEQEIVELAAEALAQPLTEEEVRLVFAAEARRWLAEQTTEA